MTANPSPMGTPQRKAAETQQSQVHRFACFSSLIKGLETYFLTRFLIMNTQFTTVLSFTTGMSAVYFFRLFTLA